jgi:eukaryotic-like serine/threonine-protein kinase
MATKNMSKVELILQHFIEKIPDPDKEIKDRYANLYSDYPKSFAKIFSHLHQTLNELFEFLNSKNRDSGGYYNAHESRQLLFIIEGIEDMNRDLIGYGEEIITLDEYQKIFDSTRLFLTRSGGSNIPENFPKIHLIHYEPVFSTVATKIRLPFNQHLDLRLI